MRWRVFSTCLLKYIIRESRTAVFVRWSVDTAEVHHPAGFKAQAFFHFTSLFALVACWWKERDGTTKLRDLKERSCQLTMLAGKLFITIS